MRERPDTRYTIVDDYAIAYQVVGHGRDDLVYLPAYVSNIEVQWLVPIYASFLEELASSYRLILVDTRGRGSSDGLVPGTAPTLEELVADVIGVMEAAGSRIATLFGAQEGAFIALLAAASHPDLISRLILFGASPSWSRSEDLPDEWSPDRWESSHKVLERATRLSEFTDAYVRPAAPSLMGDERNLRPFLALLASSMGPRAGLDESRMFSQVDLRHVLPSVQQPTLVLRRSEEQVQALSSSIYLADHLPDGRFVEVTGADSLPWLGDTRAVLDEIATFLGHEPNVSVTDRLLATVLFTDIVDSTATAVERGGASWKEMVERHHAGVRRMLNTYGGQEIDTAGDGFYATFDGPARAIECARALSEEVGSLGLGIRSGIHTGECELIDGKPGGVSVAIGARIASLAGPSEVVVSQTVKDLVAGLGLSFEDAGEHELKGVPDRWHVYRVVSGSA